MSILSIRLKQRARVLVAGVALSAATLALLPGVAEAKGGDPGGGHNANQSHGSVGTATAQKGADVKGNSGDASPQISAAHSSNRANNDQQAGSDTPKGHSGAANNNERNSNDTRGSIGVGTLQDGVDLTNNNVNASPQVSAFDSSNKARTDQQQAGGGSANNNERNSNDTTGSIGVGTLQDGVDLTNNNVNVSPQVAAFDSSNRSNTEQNNGGGSGSANKEQNSNESSGSVLTGTVQSGVDLTDNNVNASPQVSALDSSNEAGSTQQSGGSGSEPSNELNSNQTSGSIGAVTLQDGVDLTNNNANVSPQVSALDSSNNARTDQQQAGSSASGSSSTASEPNSNDTRGSIGAFTLQDLADVNNNNASVVPQVSALDSSNESNTEQNNGGGSAKEQNSNDTSGSIGVVTVQDVLDASGNNANLGPQASALKSSNESYVDQQAAGSGGNSATNEPNSNETSGSILVGTVQDGVDLTSNNANVSPQVSLLDSSNKVNTEQRSGGSGRHSANDEWNNNQTSGSIGTITAQDVLDASGNNVNASPQVAALGSSNEARTTQQSGGSSSSGPSNNELNTNQTSGSVGAVTLQDVLDVNGNNLNASPQVSVLDSSNTTNTEQNSGGDPSGDGGSNPGGGGGSPGSGGEPGGGGSGGGSPGDTGGPGSGSNPGDGGDPANTGGGSGGSGSSVGDSAGGESPDASGFGAAFPLLERASTLLQRVSSNGFGFANSDSAGSSADGGLTNGVLANGVIPLFDMLPSRSMLRPVNQEGLTLGSGQPRLIAASLGSGASETSALRFLALAAAGPKESSPASTKSERSLPDTGGSELWLGALGLTLLLCGVGITIGARMKLALKR